MIPLLMLASAAVLPNDYRRPEAWLCRPGADTVCTADTAPVTIAADGSARVTAPARPAGEPKADCFYVYPTVSLDPTPNSDMSAGVEERGTAAAQLGPFAGVCRLFAPLYRQVTLAALRAVLRGGAVTADYRLPYDDVLAAWRDYLDHDNHGRPFVLIGHSQGSKILKKLVAEEIDDTPLQRRMLSVIIPGETVAVPVGKDVGGDFKAVAPCRADRQTGCVLSWASFRDTAPPPADALFGGAAPGMVALCTNPAAPGGGVAPLDAILGFPWWHGGVAQYRAPASAPTLASRFVRVPGLLAGDCRSDGAATYLAVHVDPARAATVAGALAGAEAIGDTAYPRWGWHVVDMAIVAGDLVRLVGAQTAAWTTERRGHTASPRGRGSSSETAELGAPMAGPGVAVRSSPGPARRSSADAHR